jgi:uncharacterized protein (TIGR03437 family)
VVTVYAAGLGQTDPPSVDGSVNTGEARQPVNTVKLLINNWLAPEILYSGPAPGQVAGVTQFNFRVPALPTYEYYLLLSSGLDQDAITFVVKE